MTSEKPPFYNDKNFSNEELLLVIEEMNREIVKLGGKREEKKWLEGALRRRTNELSERVKELECLLNLLQLSLKQENPFERGAEEMIKIIKNAWQYPEATCVRIKFDDYEAKSLNFTTDGAKQIEPIMVNGRRRGEVEVGYTSTKPYVWKGPFLKEEAKLLRAISLLLSLLIAKKDQSLP